MAAAIQQQSVLEVELDRLRNSLAHLERSNRELREALQVGGPDPDFKVRRRAKCGVCGSQWGDTGRAALPCPALPCTALDSSHHLHACLARVGWTV